MSMQECQISPLKHNGIISRYYAPLIKFSRNVGKHQFVGYIMDKKWLSFFTGCGMYSF